MAIETLEQTTAETPKSPGINEWRSQHTADSGTQAETPAQTEQSASETEADEGAADSQNTAEETPKLETQADPPKRRSKLDTIRELREDKRILKEQMQANLSRLRALETQVQQSTQPKQAEAKAEPDKEQPPKIEDYQDLDEYYDARADYRIRQKEKADREERSKSEQAERQKKVSASREKVLTAGRTVFTDFDSVALAGDLPISEGMARVLDHAASSEENAKLVAQTLYHLGKNKPLAQQIAGIGEPLALGYALGQVMTDLRLKHSSSGSGNTGTKQPVKPPVVLNGGGGAATAQADDVPAYLRWKEQQKRAR
jgi:hypothetical protein